MFECYPFDCALVNVEIAPEELPLDHFVAEPEQERCAGWSEREGEEGRVRVWLY